MRPVLISCGAAAAILMGMVMVATALSPASPQATIRASGSVITLVFNDGKQQVIRDGWASQDPRVMKVIVDDPKVCWITVDDRLVAASEQHGARCVWMRGWR